MVNNILSTQGLNMHEQNHVITKYRNNNKNNKNTGFRF